MRRRAVALMAFLVAGCGNGGVTATTAPPATTLATTTTTTPATTGTWFDGLIAGVCFDDSPGPEGAFDFTVPAVLVPCTGPHDNEVVARIALGDGAYPAATIAADATARCAAAYEGFLSRPIGATLLTPFTVWPDEADWLAGARDAVCAVYSGDPMIGTAASGELTVPGAALALLVIADGSQQLWVVDAGTGAVINDLTGVGSPEATGTPTWAPDASSIAISAPGEAGDADIFLVDAITGETVELVTTTGNDEAPAIGPVGTILAYSSDVDGIEFDIFVDDFAAATTVRLTTSSDREVSPSWSPDGEWIAFRGRVGGNSDIYVIHTTTGDTVRLTDDPGFDGDPRWSPDGSQILFTSDRAGSFDIWVMDADGSNPLRLIDHPADDEYPTWSPDGSFVAFQTNRYGFPQVWVMRADGSDQSLLIGEYPSAYPSFGPPGALDSIG